MLIQNRAGLLSINAHKLSSAVELEVPRFSKRAVERAGKVLRGQITAVDAAALDAFEVAHNWRNAHVLPMRRLRAELSHRANRTNPASITAGRLKRMRSIRRKLHRLPYTLYQMQDIAGCRAIVPTIGDLRHVVASYEAGSKHERIGDDDYLAAPKRGGYRSHHQVFRFLGLGEEEAFRHQLVEVQVRTQLQHAWATAVEAVGLVRGEELKSGEGDADWLRFFALMSGEFAAEERAAMVPGVPEQPAHRREEVRELDARLNAVASLSSYRHLIQETERFASGPGSIFIIQYRPGQHEVAIRGFDSFATGSRRYEQEERTQGSGTDTVLVEVDRAADLRSAYPNYYLDVGMFLERVRDCIAGRPRPEASVVPSPALPRARWAPIDMSWWRNRPKR